MSVRYQDQDSETGQAQQRCCSIQRLHHSPFCRLTTLSDPAPMLALAAIIVLAGTVTSQAAALPQRGWSRADLLSRISSLEHTFLTRTEEMDSTFNAKQQQLRAAFG
eukprot:COSAG01_NODE_6718_length_3530_cov_5.092101_6_plen_107_part_00